MGAKTFRSRDRDSIPATMRQCASANDFSNRLGDVALKRVIAVLRVNNHLINTKLNATEANVDAFRFEVTVAYVVGNAVAVVGFD